MSLVLGQFLSIKKGISNIIYELFLYFQYYSSNVHTYHLKLQVKQLYLKWFVLWYVTSW